VSKILSIIPFKNFFISTYNFPHLKVSARISFPNFLGARIFLFPLRDFYFCFFPTPPPPHITFLMVRPLQLRSVTRYTEHHRLCLGTKSNLLKVMLHDFFCNLYRNFGHGEMTVLYSNVFTEKR
jgi:hypothetical protein